MGLQMKRLFVSALVLACASPAIAQTDRIRFWNLTANTITKFYLAPAGTDKYGPDQCVNDRDGTVDHDERLRITGVTPGRYDAKFQDKKGRVCVVKNIDVKAGGIFSIENYCGPAGVSVFLILASMRRVAISAIRAASACSTPLAASGPVLPTLG